MKIVTVVGARPQFVKAAVVSEKIRQCHKEIFVHTGQHFDENMSDIFFDEMKIPKPDYHLGIHGGTHAEMTSRMLVEVEKILKKEMPDMLLVYGDTNSTLAAALAAAKLHIPICHVEAGARTYCRNNPEEINRVCTDHISSLLLTCTKKSQDNLKNEGLATRGKLVGDPMYDAFCFYKKQALESRHVLQLLNGERVEIPDRFYYLTCHREENTIRETALEQILQAMNQLEFPTVYPVHPRNKNRVSKICEKKDFHNILLAQPVGYLTSIALVLSAEKIVTDSGGLQREAFFAQKQCVTVLDFEVWPETMIDGRNQLSSPDSNEILDRLSRSQIIKDAYQPFGDGTASVKIVREMENFMEQAGK